MTGGKAQFLTVQALVGSLSCMLLSLMQDIFPSTERYLHPLKRALLVTGFTVSSIYWTLRIFVPSLILLPKDELTTAPDLFASAAGAHVGSFPSQVVTDAAPMAELVKLPLSADLSMHAAPFIALLLDFFVFERGFSRRQMRRVAPVVMVVYGMAYASFLEYCAKCDGFFIYPFLNVSPFSVRLAIYAGAACGGFVCLRFLNELHSL
ncbi:FAR-17a/AIG1-like protein [Scleroderma yunnanense]